MKIYRVITQLNEDDEQIDRRFAAKSIDDVWEYVKTSIPHGIERIVVIVEEHPSVIILKNENLSL